jgi:hypothetical protein
MVTIVGERQWTKAQIASLSDSQLVHLNYDEMVRIVLMADVPVRNVERIQTMEGDTLVRLVHLAGARGSLPQLLGPAWLETRVKSVQRPQHRLSHSVDFEARQGR